MPVFVHEFFCSGAFDGDLSDSWLAREGLAMLAAVVADFSNIPGDAPQSRDSVVTTLDRRLRGWPAVARLEEQARVLWAESHEQERGLFSELARAAQATLVIAPETEGILLERRRMTDAAGGRFLGPATDVLELCGDKLRFCEHLTRHSLPTLPTTPFEFFANHSPSPFPLVLKPRDGAGSVNTFLIRDADELSARQRELAQSFADASRAAIAQPFVEGRPLSVAALVGSAAGDVEILPVGEQRLSRDGRFGYLGGRIPAADLAPELACEAARVVEAACRSLPGLAGWVGFDLLLTRAEPRVRIVEANPRLTTSYCGYRRLTRENLAARLLSGVAGPPIEWANSATADAPTLDAVEFDTDGNVGPAGPPNGSVRPVTSSAGMNVASLDVA
jgi:predicted ATP-grasp superfamily ATP-dependent carboligase